MGIVKVKGVYTVEGGNVVLGCVVIDGSFNSENIVTYNNRSLDIKAVRRFDYNMSGKDIYLGEEFGITVSEDIKIEPETILRVEKEKIVSVKKDLKMNDDLSLVIMYLCKNNDLHKVGIKIEHGLNKTYKIDEESDDDIEYSDVFKYWGEYNDVIIELLPLYIKNHAVKIVGVEELFAIETITVKGAYDE